MTEADELISNPEAFDVWVNGQRTPSDWEMAVRSSRRWREEEAAETRRNVWFVLLCVAVAIVGVWALLWGLR